MVHPRRARRQNTPVRAESRGDVCVRKEYDSLSRRATLVDQIVIDDWPEEVPITAAEIDVLDAFLGDLLDAFLRPRH
jgi:hypothetical protein